MPSAELLGEARRIMTICNACRYCEGFCAVFPAMERRRTFSSRDLIYLSSLCHNCRDCYYACQYAPPHEFDLNVPKTFQELRVETYMDFVWPGFLAGMFRRNGLIITMMTAVIVTIIMLSVLSQGTSIVFPSYFGKGSFYRVIPYALLVLPTSLILLWAFVAILKGALRFWQHIGGELGKLSNRRALARATADALKLRYLDGGGHGCNYPDETFTHLRRRLHHLVFYGLLLTLAATTFAAIYDHILHLTAPYPFWSLPVMLGTLGGVAIMIGSGGMIFFKWRSDKEPANSGLLGMDLAFSNLLFFTSLTGLLLLALRETSAMGMILAVHLGLVLSLFITLPYGKFVHGVYRYAALLQNAIEQLSEER